MRSATAWSSEFSLILVHVHPSSAGGSMQNQPNSINSVYNKFLSIGYVTACYVFLIHFNLLHLGKIHV